jgi:hypothetical protein
VYLWMSCFHCQHPHERNRKRGKYICSFEVLCGGRDCVRYRAAVKDSGSMVLLI